MEAGRVLANDGERPPTLAYLLGFAGLIPSIWACSVVLFGNPETRFSAVALGYAYAALILSFLGGLWWGLAAQVRAPVPGWIWFAAVTPALVSLASAIPWAIGEEWPGPSLVMLGIALVFSLAVDFRLAALGLCPPWWLGLRIPLSFGLGMLTLAIGIF